jgi:hypothetical protein
MSSAQRQSQQPGGEKLDDDSAVAILRHLEEERGKMFTEAEYHEMRGTVLEELAHGARIRPFTLFTFAVIALGLLAMLVIGLIVTPGQSAGDYALAAVSAVALIAAGYFFWSCLHGIKLDAQRSLDARLAELEQLREHRLVSPDEYHQIQAHILIARQRSPRSSTHSSPS